MNRYLIIFITLFVFPLQTSWSEDICDIKTIALIPFDNLSGENYSIAFNLNNSLYDYLKREKLHVINKDISEQFFIKRRIRNIGLINRATVRELGKALSVDAIIMGSINELSGDKNPKVNISVQMIDTLDSSIIWMNSVSISGDDFAKLLGIGKIRSIEKLVEIAINDLFKDLPETFEEKKEKGIDMPAFEIVQARFYPKVVKGDSLVGLMVEFREIACKPEQIYAFVEDIKISLISDGGNWFTGSFPSPVVEGTYILKLHAYGKFDTLYVFDAMAALIVDNTPPLIAARFHNTFISPNNDGVNDHAAFFPELLSTDSLKNWRFEITDKEGKLVRSAEGDGDDLPDKLVWRGENNNFKQVNNGIYFCRLFVEDKAGHEVSTDKIMVVVDRKAPEIEIILGKIEKDIILFDVKCNNISEIVDWSIVIYNQNDECLGTFGGKQELPSTLSCVLNNSIDNKKEKFFYSLAVRDVAGNMLYAEMRPVKIFEPDEIAEEKKNYEWVDDF
ncbi:MAG: hypothetical protein HF982_03765 [Desulfobacteraceae bacterium]|nr:hypothetical protein [Desulfobacteraceae bacterium]MBC2718702.1 gliding motility-associated C-terminal domain-containing protein [Desulfobacteraceae bacterium]